jgi:SAM-dependent methyltransferase
LGQVDTETIRRRNRSLFAGPFGPIYSYYMEHEWMSRPIAWAVWGADIRPFYDGMAEIGRAPDGATIADVPCGAGVALRGLRPDQDVRYLAIDLSPAMLGRARRRAGERGLGQVSFIEADAESLPLEAESVDLFLSYFGLHCFPNPRRALAEARRCLRDDGVLLGAGVIAGQSLRQRLLVKSNRSVFGEVFYDDQLRDWLEAGFAAVELEVSGALAYFRATAAKSA